MSCFFLNSLFLRFGPFLIGGKGVCVCQRRTGGSSSLCSSSTSSRWAGWRRCHVWVRDRFFSPPHCRYRLSVVKEADILSRYWRWRLISFNGLEVRVYSSIFVFKFKQASQQTCRLNSMSYGEGVLKYQTPARPIIDPSRQDLILEVVINIKVTCFTAFSGTYSLQGYLVYASCVFNYKWRLDLIFCCFIFEAEWIHSSHPHAFIFMQKQQTSLYYLIPRQEN